MDKRAPLISIIIPVYNVEDYLEYCLDSVLNQTYDNIEVVCVDDGSTDLSPVILQKYKKKYPNLYIYLQEKNKGQGTARNIGLQKSIGDYVLFVDSDDFIEYETVSFLVEKIQEENIDFVRFNAISFASGGEAIKKDTYDFSNYLKEFKVYNKCNFKNVYLSFVPSPVTYMFKRKIFTNNKFYFPEGIIHEDEVFSTMVFLYAESCIYINHTFYNRRYRADSTMTDKSKAQNEKSFKSYIKIIKIYQELLKDSELTSDQQFFLKYRINSIFHQILKSVETEQQKIAVDNIKEEKNYYSPYYKTYIRILKTIAIFKNKLL